MTVSFSRPRAKSRWLVLLAACTALTLVAATTVVAFAPGPGTGNASPFNASDFTPSCDPSPDPDLNSPTAADDPVLVDCDEVGGGTDPITVAWISDTLSGNSTDNAWGQGDKSDCFLAKGLGGAGACVTQVFGIGASKTDLQYHGIGLETRQASDGTDHVYLYSGIKRLQAGGITSSNANYNVEVNQLLTAYQPANPICPLDAPNTGGCNIWRSPGDLTFMTDWGGNQSSCNTPTPAICAYVWIDKSTGTGKTPSPAASTCFNAKTDPCWGLLPGGVAALSANPDKAAGSINSTASTQPSTFSEIGVDLTQSGLVPAGACETFQNVWAHSRSSSSFTAELKDFLFGEVELNTCSESTTLLHEVTDSTGNTDVTPANNGLDIDVAVGAWVKDVATVVGSAAGDDVMFRLYDDFATCDADTNHDGGTLVSTNDIGASGTATSAARQFNTIGDFYWRAFYLGGALSPSASDCNEIVDVQKIVTSVSTAQKWLPQDTATVTPAVAGTVTFSLYENGTCSGAAATTFTDATAPYETNNGTYYTVSKTISWSAAFAPTDTSTYLPSTTTRCEKSVLTITNDSGPFPPAAP